MRIPRCETMIPDPYPIMKPIPEQFITRQTTSRHSRRTGIRTSRGAWLLGLALLASPAHAAIFTWKSGVTGGWETGGNWVDDAAPTDGNQFWISSGHSTLNTEVSMTGLSYVGTGGSALATLTLADNASLTISSGEFKIGAGENTSGSVPNQGKLEIQDGGDLIYTGAFTVGGNGGSGELVMTGGTLSKTGASNFYISGGFGGANVPAGSVSGTGTYGTMTVSGGIVDIDSGGTLFIGHVGIASAVTSKGELHLSGTADVSTSAVQVGSSANTGWSGDGDGTLTITGGATLRLAAAMSVARGSALTKGKIQQTGGDIISTATGADAFVVGFSGNGTYEISGGHLVLTGNTADIRIGRDNGSTGVFTQTGGDVFVRRSLGLGTNAGSGGTLTVSGGTLNLLGNQDMSGFTDFDAPPVWSVTGTGGLYLGSGGSGVVNVSGTGEVHVYGAQVGLRLGDGATGSGTVNLDGGLLGVPYVQKGPGAGEFRFNGGVLQAKRNETNFIRLATIVRDGGAVIDTNGFDLIVTQPLHHSALESDAAIDGGLTKSGAGTLILSTVNTYTGPTTITGGTLNLTGSIGGGPVTVSGSQSVLTGYGSTGGAITVEDGAVFAPGYPVTGAPFIAAPGSTLLMESGSTFRARFDSSNGEFPAPLIFADDDVILESGVTLALDDIANAAEVLEPGTVLTLIDYSLADSFTGTFDGLAEGATLTAGVNDFILSYDDGDKVTLTANGEVDDPFATWASGIGLDGSPGKEDGFDDDPDGDGVPNGLEWILGGHPLAPDGGSLITTSATAAGGLTLAFTRNEDSIGQATLVVEYDTDLDGTWAGSATVEDVSSGPDANGVVVTIDNPNPGTDSVTVNIPASNAPDGRLFARLQSDTGTRGNRGPAAPAAVVERRCLARRPCPGHRRGPAARFRLLFVHIPAGENRLPGPGHRHRRRVHRPPR